MTSKFKSLLKGSMLALFLTIPVLVFAQGPGFDDDVEDEVPLDGGISLLAAAGIGYGIKKMKDARAKDNNK